MVRKQRGENVETRNVEQYGGNVINNVGDNERGFNGAEPGSSVQCAEEPQVGGVRWR